MEKKRGKGKYIALAIVLLLLVGLGVVGKRAYDIALTCSSQDTFMKTFLNQEFHSLQIDGVKSDSREVQTIKGDAEIVINGSTFHVSGTGELLIDATGEKPFLKLVKGEFTFNVVDPTESIKIYAPEVFINTKEAEFTLNEDSYVSVISGNLKNVKTKDNIFTAMTAGDELAYESEADKAARLKEEEIARKNRIHVSHTWGENYAGDVKLEKRLEIPGEQHHVTMGDPDSELNFRIGGNVAIKMFGLCDITVSKDELTVTKGLVSVFADERESDYIVKTNDGSVNVKGANVAFMDYPGAKCSAFVPMKNSTTFLANDGVETVGEQGVFYYFNDGSFLKLYDRAEGESKKEIKTVEIQLCTRVPSPFPGFIMSDAESVGIKSTPEEWDRAGIGNSDIELRDKHYVVGVGSAALAYINLDDCL